METRAYAVKRYLFRLGHAQRSARFATSIGQLVAGLAPVIGWGPVPREPAERARFVRAHRRSVQRWLDDLQAAGLVEHEPERDADGLWWRTQIVLLPAPAATARELASAKRRARRWGWRERSRGKRGRVAPSLGAIRGRSRVPGARRRARAAFERCAAGHAARRVAAVEAQIASAEAARAVSRDLTHPFGAPPTSAPSVVASSGARRPETSRSEGPAAQWPAQSDLSSVSVAGETGARGRAATIVPPPGATPPRMAGSEEVGPVSLEDVDALVARRVAARERAWAWRVAALEAEATDRVDQVAVWPVGRTCPLGRLREAWVARRHGLAIVVHSGTAAAGSVRPGLAVRVGRAIALYEAFADQRPPGWPASGPGALCVLAAAGGAQRFAGDVARLLGLAKGMRAAELEHDAARLERARGRAAARRIPPPAPFVFRAGSPRAETAEARRCRVRDAILLAGGDPAAWPNAALAIAHVGELRAAAQPRLLEPDRCEELDGLGARAARYRAELARGRWQLPHRFPTTERLDPREESAR